MTLLTVDMKYTIGMLIQVSIGCVGTAVPVIFGDIQWQLTGNCSSKSTCHTIALKCY